MEQTNETHLLPCIQLNADLWTSKVCLQCVYLCVHTCSCASCARACAPTRHVLVTFLPKIKNKLLSKIQDPKKTRSGPVNSAK
jgi:hypothetical protein